MIWRWLKRRETERAKEQIVDAPKPPGPWYCWRCERDMPAETDQKEHHARHVKDWQDSKDRQAESLDRAQQIMHEFFMKELTTPEDIERAHIAIEYLRIRAGVPVQRVNVTVEKEHSCGVDWPGII